MLESNLNLFDALLFLADPNWYVCVHLHITHVGIPYMQNIAKASISHTRYTSVMCQNIQAAIVLLYFKM